MKVNGELERAQLECGTADPTALAGRVSFRTDKKCAAVSDGTVTRYLQSLIIPQTSFTVADNQVAAADVTGLLLDSTKAKTYFVKYEMRRASGGAELVSAGQLVLVYDDSEAAWKLVGDEEWGVADDGVTFSVTAGGQVQYTSTSIGGAGTMKFWAEAPWG